MIVSVLGSCFRPEVGEMFGQIVTSFDTEFVIPPGNQGIQEYSLLPAKGLWKITFEWTSGSPVTIDETIFEIDTLFAVYWETAGQFVESGSGSPGQNYIAEIDQSNPTVSKTWTAKPPAELDWTVDQNQSATCFMVQDEFAEFMIFKAWQLLKTSDDSPIADHGIPLIRIRIHGELQ